VSAASASPRAAAQAAPGFEPAATLGAREPAPSAAVGGVSGVGSLEALLALQEAPGPIALTSALADQRSKTDEESLEGVLDEIETRALVEQAKAEVARQTPPNAA
jgi:hypothetical protein